jgi:carbonic anhydrase
MPRPAPRLRVHRAGPVRRAPLRPAVAALALGIAWPLAPVSAAEPVVKPVPVIQRAPARPVAPEAPQTAPAARPSPVDPLDRVRERLAEKLGARPASGAGQPQVLQVANRSGNVTVDGEPLAAAAAGRPGAAPARPASRPPARANESAAHWGYEGEHGPAAWARLRPEFSLCGSGRRQSPIDIRDGIRVELEPVRFDYRPGAFGVVDNGHTVQVNVAPGNAIEVLGRRYELQQFHFHRPSEERVDGRLFDMSAHLVHRDAEGRLAVVAVLLERGPAQPVVQSVWNNLPLEKGEEQPARVPLDPAALLPADRRYYTYMGSLTTPPCTENVLWMVMQQPVTLSAEQLAIFARLYPLNARPVQQASGRLIKQSD